MITILRKYLKPYALFILLCLAVLFGQAMCELYLPNLMSTIVNKGIVQGDLTVIYTTGAKMLGITFLGAFFAITASFFSAQLAIGLGRDVRMSIFRKIEGYSLHEFEQIGAASLITRTTNDIVQIQQVVVMGFRFIVYSPIMCIGGLIMAFSKDTTLSIIFIIVVPLLVLIMVLIAKYIIPSFKSMQKKIDNLNRVLRENLTGVRVIRAFNKMEYEKSRFDNTNKDLTKVAIKINRVMALMMPLMMFIMNATTISIIWFGGLRVSNGQIDIGNMMAFTQYAMQIISSVLMISIMFVMIPRAEASAVRVNEVMAIKDDILDPPSPKKPDMGIRGQVEFRNVSFKYASSELPILENISFSSNKGETTAIIGGTGSGKSTIINLIPRLYDTTSGEVLINGVKTSEMTQKDLRDKIAFVPQEPLLFSGTVSDNIRLGKKDASEDEIKHAAKIAQAYEFINNMPEKFDTPISQGGTNVSGGQKQRLSIARAIIRKPEIYIFDDSFSALDFKTDAALRAALKQETKDSTVIIVAQRVSSIMDCDRIIVLEDGKIVGMGTHTELLKNCDVYQQICSSQLSKEELA